MPPLSPDPAVTAPTLLPPDNATTLPPSGIRSRTGRQRCVLIVVLSCLLCFLMLQSSNPFGHDSGRGDLESLLEIPPAQEDRATQTTALMQLRSRFYCPIESSMERFLRTDTSILVADTITSSNSQNTKKNQEKSGGTMNVAAQGGFTELPPLGPPMYHDAYDDDQFCGMSPPPLGDAAASPSSASGSTADAFSTATSLTALWRSTSARKGRTSLPWTFLPGVSIRQRLFCGSTPSKRVNANVKPRSRTLIPWPAEVSLGKRQYIAAKQLIEPATANIDDFRASVVLHRLTSMISSASSFWFSLYSTPKSFPLEDRNEKRPPASVVPLDVRGVDAPTTATGGMVGAPPPPAPNAVSLGIWTLDAVTAAFALDAGLIRSDVSPPRRSRKELKHRRRLEERRRLSKDKLVTELRQNYFIGAHTEHDDDAQIDQQRLSLFDTEAHHHHRFVYHHDLGAATGGGGTPRGSSDSNNNIIMTSPVALGVFLPAHRVENCSSSTFSTSSTFSAGFSIGSGAINGIVSIGMCRRTSTAFCNVSTTAGQRRAPLAAKTENQEVKKRARINADDGASGGDGGSGEESERQGDEEPPLKPPPPPAKAAAFVSNRVHVIRVREAFVIPLEEETVTMLTSVGCPSAFYPSAEEHHHSHGVWRVVHQFLLPLLSALARHRVWDTTTGQGEALEAAIAAVRERHLRDAFLAFRRRWVALPRIQLLIAGLSSSSSTTTESAAKSPGAGGIRRRRLITDLQRNATKAFLRFLRKRPSIAAVWDAAGLPFLGGEDADEDRDSKTTGASGTGSIHLLMFQLPFIAASSSGGGGASTSALPPPRCSLIDVLRRGSIIHQILSSLGLPRSVVLPPSFSHDAVVGGGGFLTSPKRTDADGVDLAFGAVGEGGGRGGDSNNPATLHDDVQAFSSEQVAGRAIDAFLQASPEAIPSLRHPNGKLPGAHTTDREVYALSSLTVMTSGLDFSCGGRGSPEVFLQHLRHDRSQDASMGAHVARGDAAASGSVLKHHQRMRVKFGTPETFPPRGPPTEAAGGSSGGESNTSAVASSQPWSPHAPLNAIVAYPYYPPRDELQQWMPRCSRYLDTMQQLFRVASLAPTTASPRSSSSAPRSHCVSLQDFMNTPPTVVILGNPLTSSLSNLDEVAATVASDPTVQHYANVVLRRRYAMWYRPRQQGCPSSPSLKNMDEGRTVAEPPVKDAEGSDVAADVAPNRTRRLEWTPRPSTPLQIVRLSDIADIDDDVGTGEQRGASTPGSMTWEDLMRLLRHTVVVIAPRGSMAGAAVFADIGTILLTLTPVHMNHGISLISDNVPFWPFYSPRRGNVVVMGICPADARLDEDRSVAGELCRGRSAAYCAGRCDTSYLLAMTTAAIRQANVDGPGVGGTGGGRERHQPSDGAGDENAHPGDDDTSWIDGVSVAPMTTLVGTTADGKPFVFQQDQQDAAVLRAAVNMKRYFAPMKPPS